MIKTLFKNSLVYTTSAFLQKSLIFLLLPFYTTYLGPEEFGQITIVLSLTYVFSILYTLGLDSAIVRFYYDSPGNENFFKPFFGTLILSILTISIINYLLAVTLIKPAIQFLFKDVPFNPYGYLGFAILLFQPIYNFSLSYLQAKNQALKYALLSWLYFAINISLTLILVVVLELKGVGYLSAILISQGFSSLIALILFRKDYKICFNLKYLKHALRYSGPLIPHSIASQASSYADRFIINRTLNPSAVGVYQIAYLISMPVELLAFSINRAFTPIFFDEIAKNTGMNKLIDSTFLILLLYLIVASCISLFNFEILSLFFDPSFQSAAQVIPLIAFAYVNSGLYYMFSTPLFYEKKLTKYIPYITIASGVVTIVFDFLLIPHYGILGAAWSILLGQITLSIVAYFYSLKNKNVRWPVKKFLAACFSFAMGVFSFRWMAAEDGSILNFVFKVLLIVGLVSITSWIFWRDAFFVYKKLTYLKSKFTS